jgi:hypothetical protein
MKKIRKTIRTARRRRTQGNRKRTERTDVAYDRSPKICRSDKGAGEGVMFMAFLRLAQSFQQNQNAGSNRYRVIALLTGTKAKSGDGGRSVLNEGVKHHPQGDGMKCGGMVRVRKEGVPHYP